MLDPWLAFVISLALAVAAAVALTAAVALVIRLVAKRMRWPEPLVRHTRRPFRVVVLIIALWIAVAVAFPASGEGSWREVIYHALTICVIAAGAWLMAGLVAFSTDITLGRNRIDVANNRVARRIRTQTLILRRLAVAVIVIIALGAILLTFPAVRTVGASLLASAGIASVVAGLAAQSVLANIFAGLQLVFSEALRVDDVVVVEDEWGRIGEITLSYVVVDLWDDRRLVLPCTYFTTQPFQNWTRQGSELLGSVELDVDWRVSPALMRERLAEVLTQTDLWDGRAQVLQVTEATGGLVRIRILVTAVDAPTLFDLRCFVREAMVTWLQRTMPSALPVQRVLITEPAAHDDAATRASREEDTRSDDTSAGGSGLFTGSVEAQERASVFTNAIPIIDAEDRDR
ncbi:mechanosensitive ion channel family protein [Pseudoclavibacter terrae]|uniref:mechanosensitive ion channel family protein n=1 Tax=Pseudoclavibacter terrae TaxID=1530195 RepID=UPI002330B330|nr:mechanosensitive ion channel domain-containing protein [Pseudoclavibacter terrae]